MTIITKTIDIGGKALILETGRIAKQANGAIFATFDEQEQGRRAVLPTFLRLPGAILRSWPHSRQLLPSRRSPDRERDACQPHD
jgi:hypothetical protein